MHCSINHIYDCKYYIYMMFKSFWNNLRINSSFEQLKLYLYMPVMHLKYCLSLLLKTINAN